MSGACDRVIVEAPPKVQRQTRVDGQLVANKPGCFVLIDLKRRGGHKGDPFHWLIGKSIDFYGQKLLAPSIC